MEHVKLQIGCLVILLYIAFIYYRECKIYRQKKRQSMFTTMLSLGILCVLFDGITAYMVNQLDVIHPMVNMVFHALFLLSIDAVIFALCMYMLVVTGAYAKGTLHRWVVYVPFVLNVIVVIANIGTLEYREGNFTNYSMGMSAYTCFAMAAVYALVSIGVFLKKWHYIENHKRMSIFTYLMVLAVVTGIQMVFPEVLATSIGVTVFIVGIYLNLENPAYKQLSLYHEETVMAFANIIENRDDNTGGHIKRTSIYVKLIAEELRKREKYKAVLTKDYIGNLVEAAPMHDIGKIAVPDAVLQKPGRLTEEEFSQMKLHASKGGEIIKETFRNLGGEDYRRMAYEVARYHHEKWNGRGYPEGLKGENIPLCARIMAVADVFDAVSEKRCYRDAMPLEECFDIIAKGSGQDFDPVIAEAFLGIKDEVIRVHGEFAEKNMNVD
ncbi:MAG: HD domain-containing protein [Lachnospiraceae bacterium]|nr:HD domain-containing protein [Lachnospiraceae bacterium]